MNKYIIGAVVVILALIGIYVITKPKSESVVVNPPPVVVPAAPQVQTYSTSTYSVTYPADFTIDEAYAYQGVPKKPIPGVKFTISSTMATGTNLSSDSGVSIETLPHANKCSGDIYMYQNVKSRELIVASTTFSVASTTDAGAGNLREEIVYAIPNSHPCTALRYMIHTTNMGNYPEGTVREFDRAALMTEFDKIRDSLMLSQ